MTRAQIATLLIEALRWETGEDHVAADGPYFEDVAGVHAANIDAAAELGLMFGHEDGRFGPSRATRRDQMASVVVRFLRTLEVS